MCDFCEEQREKSELEYKGIYLQYVYKEEKKHLCWCTQDMI